jgi:secreted trypsin-like serine protease
VRESRSLFGGETHIGGTSKEGAGLRYGDEAGTRFAGRYLLALVFATLLALGAAVPVFAVEEPTEEDGGVAQPQVVGGDSVPNGKYKFMVAVRDVTRGNTVYQQQFCGGTLIDRDSVLTAAHCVEGVRAARLRATVGRTVLKSDQGQTRRVDRIFRHPMYNSAERGFRYDAAVLKLDSRVRNISPIRIPVTSDDAFEEPGRLTTVAGWGTTSYSDSNRSNRMREAQVPIVSDARAKEVYRSSYVNALMVAAGQKGTDTCKGDSGGPLFVETSTEVFNQIGITSFGKRCALRGYPGVYTETNASSIRSFIYDKAAL